jgi:malonate-semialdehyde dehydrogenase (acetylating)/methylmalonate-semialdehyde dehydrogenase
MINAAPPASGQATADLKRGRDMKTVGNFIGGQVCLSSSNQTVDVHNPASGQVERRVTQSTAAEVKQAIDVAHRAFADWSRTTPLRRASTAKCTRMRWAN